MTYTGRKLYRSRHGEILGVCKGIAEWRDLPVNMVRLLFILIAIASAIVPCLIIYLIMGLVLPMEPGYRTGRRSDDDHKARGGKQHYGFDDIKSEFDNLKQRVNRMEDEATSDKETDWDRRFHDKD